jgi:hypothetical protein
LLCAVRATGAQHLGRRNSSNDILSGNVSDAADQANFSNSSRPISIRRISLVPAPIS